MEPLERTGPAAVFALEGALVRETFPNFCVPGMSWPARYPLPVIPYPPCFFPGFSTLWVSQSAAFPTVPKQHKAHVLCFYGIFFPSSVWIFFPPPIRSGSLWDKSGSVVFSRSCFQLQKLQIQLGLFLLSFYPMGSKMGILSLGNDSFSRKYSKANGELGELRVLQELFQPEFQDSGGTLEAQTPLGQRGEFHPRHSRLSVVLLAGRSDGRQERRRKIRREIRVHAEFWGEQADHLLHFRL